MIHSCNLQSPGGSYSTDDKEVDRGTDVAVLNPLVAMAAVRNPAMADLAGEVTAALQRVVDRM